MAPDKLAEDKLTSVLHQYLEELQSRGFELPWYMAIMGRNGYVIIARYVKAANGLTAEFLAEHDAGAGLALPINVFFVDSNGEAARLLIEQKGGDVLSSRWVN